MKRLCTLLLCLILLLSSFGASAQNSVSSWAKEHFDYLNSIGVCINPSDNGNYSEPIERLQFAQIIYDSYKSYTETDPSGDTFSPFNDTAAPAAIGVFALGIASGDENKNFNPDDNLTRQEAAKMLCNYYFALHKEPLLALSPKAYLYDDAEKMAEWSKEYISIASSSGLMQGKEKFIFAPLDNLTIEEAVVLVSRALQLDVSSLEEEPFNTPIVTDGETATISWYDLPYSHKYYVKIVEYRNTNHGLEMGSKEPIVYVTDKFELTFNTKPVRRYEITITEGTEVKKMEVTTPQIRPFSENLAEIESYVLPQTKEEADALMETVTVDIWTIKNGEKVPSTATFMVHQAIAEKVKLIFDEIFSGKEKFPFNSVSGYAWRGGISEHNYGTAIDINPNENYCIYGNGTIVGSYYKPYTDPYSITPFGEVVEIFEKYGFNWGADTWRSNRDYMHFSYCGT